LPAVIEDESPIVRPVPSDDAQQREQCPCIRTVRLGQQDPPLKFKLAPVQIAAAGDM